MKNETVEHGRPLEHLAPLGRIGLIALATDFNIESDLRRIYPGGIEIFTSRVLNINPLTIENLRTMAPKISSVAATLLPGTDLDAIIYACTSGTAAIGADRIQELIHQSCPNVPVINPIDAVCSAFEQFKAKRISILTPYTQSVNAELAATFAARGYDILNISGFAYEDDTAMTFISPEDITEAAINTCDPDADLLFISCTALRASLVIHDIERQINKPVISSNQALAWKTMQQVQHHIAIDGFGSLMQHSPNSNAQ